MEPQQHPEALQAPHHPEHCPVCKPVSKPEVVESGAIGGDENSRIARHESKVMAHNYRLQVLRAIMAVPVGMSLGHALLIVEEELERLDRAEETEV